MSFKPTQQPDYTPDLISLKIASPDRIRQWSFGEIQKPETINYRTGRSERGGLFDERVFGPEKDYQCYCGKYKGIRYNGIICEKCGVEITRAIVRRERMGHIELASPVAHIWMLRSVPSRMALLLDVTVSSLEKVVYFAGYIITQVYQDEKDRVLKELEQEYKAKQKTIETEGDKEKLKDLYSVTRKEILELIPERVLTEAEYHKFSRKYSTVFDAGIGAEAVYEIFKKVDLEQLAKDLEKKLEKTDKASKEKSEKRLQVVRSMIASKQRPEWMFLQAVPVIPPALRPMVALEGGRHATSDVNDLYRRVINRNNRLRKLKDIGAPDVILRNEKRILQEAVDSLIDNTIRKHSGTVAMSQSQRRQLKSLADNLKGKQGLLRGNLLGKRVDYSGRSVIVVGPTLKLNQCGLPKYMALELFRPFVISKLIERELSFNIRGAGKLIEEASPEVWEILEEVIQGKYVLLNRAPTLHRLSIVAFHPVLIEGKAIQVHPLVCSGFNADFDGDQMAVHVPLSFEAQREAEMLMASNKNLLRPGSGDPITVPSLDMALGCYWMTKMITGKKGEGKYFASPNEAILAYDYGFLDVRSKITVLPGKAKRYAQFEGKPFETTVGRLLFNTVLPDDYGYVNSEFKKKDLSILVEHMIDAFGVDYTALALDKIKDFGYKYVTLSGTTFSMDEAVVPPEKAGLIKEARARDLAIREQYEEGLISDDERYRKSIEIWESTASAVGKCVEKAIVQSESISDMFLSGARGSASQLNQVSGLKGMIINNAGRIIDFPIVSSYKEGLTPLEYFITNHGSRKGLSDTALNTAKAGYLTRKLAVVGQDIVVTEEDCETKKALVLRSALFDGTAKTFGKQVYGRVLAETLKDSSGEVLIKKGTLIGKPEMKLVIEKDVKEVIVRSPLCCESVSGICRHCYGLDLGRNGLVKFGEAVGIVSAQAIGEPGTQLTLRTVHAGGVAGQDITMGLPRVEQLFECQPVKVPATISTVNGEIHKITVDADSKVIEVIGDEIKGEDGSKTVSYEVDPRRTIMVKQGQKVRAGEALTDGSIDLEELFVAAGQERAQEYIIQEITKVYDLHSAPVARKHLEIIARQMFSRRKITTAGDTRFTTGDIVEAREVLIENKEVEARGGMTAKAEVLLKGISNVALTAHSWLSSASFQNTTRILVQNAIRGKNDELRGLMENVIVGNLVPAGTGLNPDFISGLHPKVEAVEEIPDIVPVK